jgi:signal transduction histidine kinase
VQGLARRESAGVTWFPVDAALDESVRLLSRKLRKHNVRAELALGLGNVQIHANRPQVQQVVINLLLNAIDALAGVEGRERYIELASRRLGPDTIEVSVTDNGPGVAAIDRDHIFDALFSTKTNGTGVGLSISRAIAEAHGGHLAYRPCTPFGAVFTLVLATDAAHDEGHHPV